MSSIDNKGITASPSHRNQQSILPLNLSKSQSASPTSTSSSSRLAEAVAAQRLPLSLKVGTSSLKDRIKQLDPQKEKNGSTKRGCKEFFLDLLACIVTGLFKSKIKNEIDESKQELMKQLANEFVEGENLKTNLRDKEFIKILQNNLSSEFRKILLPKIFENVATNPANHFLIKTCWKIMPRDLDLSVSFIETLEQAGIIDKGGDGDTIVQALYKLKKDDLREDLIASFLSPRFIGAPNRSAEEIVSEILFEADGKTDKRIIDDLNRVFGTDKWKVNNKYKDMLFKELKFERANAIFDKKLGKDSQYALIALELELDPRLFNQLDSTLTNDTNFWVQTIELKNFESLLSSIPAKLREEEDFWKTMVANGVKTDNVPEEFKSKPAFAEKNQKISPTRDSIQRAYPNKLLMEGFRSKEKASLENGNSDLEQVIAKVRNTACKYPLYNVLNEIKQLYGPNWKKDLQVANILSKEFHISALTFLYGEGWKENSELALIFLKQNPLAAPYLDESLKKQ